MLTLFNDIRFEGSRKTRSKNWFSPFTELQGEEEGGWQQGPLLYFIDVANRDFFFIKT